MKKLILILSFMIGTSIAQGETLVILTENLPPFQIQKNDTIGGIRTEIIRAIANETGMNYQIRVYPWARAYQMALNDKNTLIYSLIRFPKREKLFKWVGKIGAVVGRLYKVKSRKDIKLKKLEDAKSYMIGVARKDFTHQFLSGKGFEKMKHLQVVHSMDLARKMLFRGRVDLILDDEVTLEYSAMNLGLDVSEFEEALIIPEFAADHYLAASLKTPDQTVNRLKKALEKIRKNGSYDQIIKKWRKQVRKK